MRLILSLLFLLFSSPVGAGETRGSPDLPLNEVWAGGGTLNQYVTAIGSATKTLVISQPISVGSTTTVPTNVILVFTGDGLINCGGTPSGLVIYKMENPGIRPIFIDCGEGTMVIKPGAVTNVFPEWWGAEGRAKRAETCAITSGQATLTCPVGTFVETDIGRTVSIGGAGSGGNHLLSTVQAYTSDTQVTLANNASTTKSDTYIAIGQDDAPAIRNAVVAVGLGGGGSVFLSGAYHLTTKDSANQCYICFRYSNVALTGTPGTASLYWNNSGGGNLIAARKSTASLMPDIEYTLNTATAGDATVTLATASDAGNIAKDDWLLIRTFGQSTSGVVVNGEVNRALSAGVAGTGVVSTVYPLAKTYVQKRCTTDQVCYPGFFPFGVVRINEYVLENIWVENISIIAYRGTVIGGRYVVGGGIRNVIAKVGDGAFGGFGSRNLMFFGNQIHLVGSGPTGGGSWLFCDTVGSHMHFEHNTLTATNAGFLQLHEFCSHLIVRGNVMRSRGSSGNDETLYGHSGGIRNSIIDSNILDQGVNGTGTFLEAPHGSVFSNNVIRAPSNNTVVQCKFSETYPGGGIFTIPETTWKQDPQISATVANNRVDTDRCYFEDPGSYSLQLFPPDGGAWSTALPIRGIWKRGAIIRQSILQSGSTLGWGVWRTGQAAPTWVSLTDYYSLWQPSTAYPLNALLIPNDPSGNGHYYKVTTAGTSTADPPTWPTGSGSTVTNGTAVFTEQGVLAEVPLTNYRQYVVPTADNGHVYRVTMGGSCAAVEPAWNTGAGSTTTDANGCVFTEAGTAVLLKALANL